MITLFLIEYNNILSFLLLCNLVGVIMFILVYLLIIKEYDNEKISIYECGFSAFEEDSRDLFDVRFYLVSILFIVFERNPTISYKKANFLSLSKMGRILIVSIKHGILLSFENL